ncbi:chemotaxis protein CheW [Parasalinivibrio latis]|uniref:chemotaxis protein CheW n=1 Tax=Parasalinivibrio latis TaxID=2952610 RepID=UPI0030E48A1D
MESIDSLMENAQVNDITIVGNDFLSFCLGDELYAVDIKKVEEIRVWENPTPIPKSPHYLCGVINLRGMIVPIMDLRSRFELGEAEYLPTTVVLILRAGEEAGNRTMGIVADAVSDVVNDAGQTLMPALGDSQVTPFISGLLTLNEHVLSVFNVDSLLMVETMLAGQGAGLSLVYQSK